MFIFLVILGFFVLKVLKFVYIKNKCYIYWVINIIGMIKGLFILKL